MDSTASIKAISENLKLLWEIMDNQKTFYMEALEHLDECPQGMEELDKILLSDEEKNYVLLLCTQ